MISASHNPFYDNGIKLMNGKGEKMDDELQDAIEDYIDGKTEEIPFAAEDHIGCTVDFYTGRNRYIGFLTNLAIRPFDDHKVALDCSNGSSWMSALPLTETRTAAWLWMKTATKSTATRSCTSVQST
jgi:phosphoglucosamine mutase